MNKERRLEIIDTISMDVIDYKNADILKAFLTPQAKIVSTRRSSLTAKLQRKLARETKRARFLAIVPYVTR